MTGSDGTSLWQMAFYAAIVIAILMVMIPVLGRRRPWQTSVQSELDRLFEAKSRALRALKDLDHEREAGLLSDADWQETRTSHITEAVRLNRAISELTGVAPPSGDAK